MYLSSGAVMDGLAFSPWQVDGKRRGKQPRHQGGLWGGFAKQLWVGGRRGLLQLFNMKGIISAPAFSFPSCITAPGSSCKVTAL